MLFARAASGKSFRTLPGKKNKIVFQQRSKKSWHLFLHEVTSLGTKSLYAFNFN